MSSINELLRKHVTKIIVKSDFALKCSDGTYYILKNYQIKSCYFSKGIEKILNEHKPLIIKNVHIREDLPETFITINFTNTDFIRLHLTSSKQIEFRKGYW